MLAQLMPLPSALSAEMSTNYIYSAFLHTEENGVKTHGSHGSGGEL